MSSMVLEPPSTRLEIGHEVKMFARSTITTSMEGSHMRMYFAAVAPPKPPPITTTRALGVVVAQPAAASAAAAPVSLRKSRRSKIVFMASSSLLLCREIVGDQLDLPVGVALGDLVHDGRGLC